MNPLLSVIVPVYNVSKYIEKCLDSLQKQTLKNIQIYIIDDCGNDDSIKKAQLYVKKDSRFHIIKHTNNQGLAESRNTGLKYVTSEFVAFLDSDDWIAPDYYEKLYNKLIESGSDIAVSDVFYYHQKEFRLAHEWVSDWNFKPRKKIITSIQDKQFLIYACACWNKLYKTSIFKDYDLKFPKGLKIEDVPITTATTVLAKKIVLVPEAKLFYRIREDSIMGMASSTRTSFDIFKIYNYTDDLLKSVQTKLTNKNTKKYKQIVDNFKIFNIFSWYNGTPSIFKEEFFYVMKRYFKAINIVSNPFISTKSRTIYRSVCNAFSFEFKTTFRLFNLCPLITKYDFQNRRELYFLDKYKFLTEIHSFNKSRYYLFDKICLFKTVESD